MFVVIIAGGSGKRFWPLSYQGRPKQLLNITGDGTLLELAIKRAKLLTSADKIFIATNKMIKAAVLAEIPDFPIDNFIIEPVGRNTAPCIGLAAITLREINPEETMIVMPADHLILNTDSFVEAIKEAETLARVSKGLVTLGIKPTYPETGFGYIEADTNIQTRKGFGVKQFHEKPSKEKAREYVGYTNFYWNSGIFIWRIDAILREFKISLPAMFDQLSEISEHLNEPNELSVLEKIFPQLEDISIDYGIMEKSRQVYVIPTDFDWTDVGSWLALEKLIIPDESGNYIQADLAKIDTSNCLIFSSNPNKRIATIDVDNLIIVDTPQGLLICKKSSSQKVKDIYQ